MTGGRPVTVLSFADTRFPIERANGLQTMATCHALAQRGHDVTLVVRPDNAAVARDPFAFYGLPPAPRLTIRRLGAATGGAARRATFLVGAAAICAGAGDAIVFTRDLGLASILLQLPRIRRPRLIYESHGIAPVVAAEMPALLDNPALTPSPRKVSRLDRRERRVWTHARAIVAITAALADELAGRFGSRPGVFVVPDGVDLPGAMASDAEDAATPGGAVVAAYAGHLYPWKGVDIFVRALAQAPGVRGLIIGGHPGEPDAARIQALAQETGVADRLEMTGLLPPAAVAPRLRRADILVLPNTASAISSRYTSPLKLFEYLAAGRAIVASDLPAIREVLTDGRTSLLVAPGDPAALARALTALAADPAKRAALGAAARLLAPDYSWARRAERLEAALELAAS